MSRETHVRFCEHLGGKFPGVTRPVVESYFGTLKQERVQWRHYQTRYEAQQDILEYISMFYNSRRLHSHLGYMSANDYERQLTETKNAA